MSAAKAAKRKNLLLCFDAFGTLFTPNTPVPVAYAAAATRHGIQCGDFKDPHKIDLVAARFKAAFKKESQENPNYGKAVGLGAQEWWGKVIKNTFTPYLSPGQKFPPGLIPELLHRYASKDGYMLYSDVLPFFARLRHKRTANPENYSWTWDKTIVGIITNSDNRVPGILQSFGLKVRPRRFGIQYPKRMDATIDEDISFAIMSYDVGVEKPKPKIFHAATSMLEQMLEGNKEGLTVDDFDKVHVGDDIEKDYDGARAAGWNSILLQRDFEGPNVATSGGFIKRAGIYPLGKAEVFQENQERRVLLLARDLGALDSFHPSKEDEDG